MFYKELIDGRYRFYLKYWNEITHKWSQVSCTMSSASRQSQLQAKKILEEKVRKKNCFVSADGLVKNMYQEWLGLREAELKESTFITQKQNFVSFIRAFGDKDVAEITSKDIQFYLMSQDWSIAYKKHIKSLLKMFFNYCFKMKMIEVNPVDDVILPKRTKTLEEIRKAESKFYSRKEMKRFLKYLRAEGYSERMNLTAEFMYLTGLRFGEVLALTEDDLFLGQNYIRVEATLTNRTKTKEFKRTSPKTLRAYRKVYINTRVKEIINRMLDLNCSRSNNSRLIFLNELGQPIQNFTFNAYLKKFSKAANMRNDVVLTSHVLRHSHVCLLAELGVGQKVIMERMGHSDEKTTLLIYTHVTKVMVFDLSDKLEGLTI